MEEAVIRSEPAGAEAPKTETRPDNVPEKFWDKDKGAVRVDALLNSYTELEKMRGKPADNTAGAESKPADPPKQGETPPPEKPPENVKEALAEKKIDFDALTAEYTENGSLKPESYEALEKAGIPKAVVDDYISSQAQRAETFKSEMHESVGGEENFTSMIRWAAENMTPAEVEAYNAALDKGPASIKLAVAGLHDKYIKATGGTPKLYGGKPASGVTGYRSHAEQQRDMQDARYKTDPAFREEVTARSLASNF